MIWFVSRFHPGSLRYSVLVLLIPVLSRTAGAGDNLIAALEVLLMLSVSRIKSWEDIPHEAGAVVRAVDRATGEWQPLMIAATLVQQGLLLWIAMGR